MGCYVCGTTHVKEFHFSGEPGKDKGNGGFGRINDDASVYTGILQSEDFRKKSMIPALQGRGERRKKLLAHKTGLSNGG